MTDTVAKIFELLQSGKISQNAAHHLIAAVRHTAPETLADAPIAVIGVTFELPGASNEDQLWSMLVRGMTARQPPTVERQRLAQIVSSSTAGVAMATGYLSDIDKFDTDFFSILPGEARVIDPQQRKMLQLAYRCFEQSGQISRIRGSRTGVFFAAEDSGYRRGIRRMDPLAVTGILPSFVGSRISNYFDLKGPAYITPGDDSSALIALHDACAALRADDCDMALVGGVSLLPALLPSNNAYHRASSPFGDEPSPGVRAEAMVTVLLKPLAKAEQHGDPIRAVITGSGVTHPGARSMPDVETVTQLLRDTWRRAGLDPSTLVYIEADAAGMTRHDQTEIEAISHAIRDHTHRPQFIAVGSIKPNVGRPGVAAAALVGLVKAVLVLERGEIPPTCGIDTPNRHIDFLDSPLYLPTWRQPLPRNSEPRVAAINSFGSMGTAAHVVLQAAPPKEIPTTLPTTKEFVFPISAKTPDALRKRLQNLADARIDAPAVDVAATLCLHREHFEHRCVVLADNILEFQQRCRDLAAHPSESPSPVGRLTELVTAYLNHSPCDWNQQFQGLHPRFATIPAYPFASQSHWIEPAPGRDAGPEHASLTPDIVLETIASALGTDTVDEEATFFDLGGNSLSALRVLMHLRDHGAVVSLDDVVTTPSIGDLVHVLLARTLEAAPLPDGKAHGNAFPLSEAQQRFWYLQHAEEAKGGAYHVPSVVKLTGAFDTDALRRSLVKLQQRHDVLRSRYPTDHLGVPTMKIDKAPELPLEVRSLRSGSLAAEIRGIIDRPFELPTGPVWRAVLIKGGDGVHLVLVLHHLVADIWALDVLYRELWQLYRAELNNQPARLEPIRISYGELSKQEQRETARFEADQQFWSRQLAGASTGLTLATDVNRMQSPDRPVTIEFTVPEDIAKQARDVANSVSATPFAVYLATFSVLMRWRTKADDLLLGTEVYNRSRAGADAVLGVFVNQVPVRVNTAGNPTFVTLVRQTRATLQATLEHGGYSYQRISKLMKRDARGLFQAKLLYNLYHDEGEQPADGLRRTFVNVEEVVSPFHTTLRLLERADGTGAVRCSFTYQAQLFTEQEVELLTQQFRAILKNGVSHPELHISSIFERSIVKERKRIMSARSMRGQRRSRNTELFQTELLERHNGLQPLLIRPTVGGVNLGELISMKRDFIETKLLEHGAIMFRGFDISRIEDFRAAAEAVNPDFVEYSEPSTPRGEYEDKVYVSSEYPAWYEIPLHGELSYTYEWPMKALFFSKLPAAKGGATTIGDARRILDRLSDRVREKFEQKKIMYVRNYGDGLLVPWQTVFNTDKPEEVEAHCAANPPMSFEWLSAESLRTKQVRSATRTHPITGETVWFNQAHIFHPYSLGREMRDRLVEQFGPNGMPVTACYGDGDPIEDRDLDDIYQAMTQSRYSTPWEQGDVLLADNMLVSHGRESFEGDRETVVCFVEPCTSFEPDQVPTS